MAELDIKGFVTPEQQFAGLYKLAEDVSARNAAKAKADEVAKANKAALEKYAENKFNTKDYLSGTVADPNITKKLAEGIQQVNTFISQNKGATESQIQLFASPIISQVAQDSEKSKELKRQMELGLEQIKGMKGVNANKFRESFQNRAWGIKDGQLPDNLNNVDITHNYIDDVLNNDDIYNAEAVRESIKNIPLSDYQYSQTTRDKSGVQKSTLYDVKSQDVYQPVKDASGKPTGDFEPKYVPFTNGDEVVMHEWIGDDGAKTKAPIKLLDEDAFNKIFSPKNNAAAAALLRNEVKKHTEGKTPIDSSQAEYLARALAYNLVKENMTGAPSIKIKEEQKQPLPPKVTVNVGGAGGADDENEYTGNVYDEIDLSQYNQENKKPLLLNNKVITLKEGVAEYEDGTPVQKGVIKVDANDLPASIEQLIKATYPKYPLKDFAFLTIKDGQITDVQYADVDASGTPVDKSTKISRQTIENWQTGQKKKLTKKKNVGGLKFGKKAELDDL